MLSPESLRQFTPESKGGSGQAGRQAGRQHDEWEVSCLPSRCVGFLPGDLIIESLQLQNHAENTDQ